MAEEAAAVEAPDTLESMEGVVVDREVDGWRVSVISHFQARAMLMPASISDSYSSMLSSSCTPSSGSAIRWAYR